MRWCLLTVESAKYILPVTRATSVTPVSPYNHCASLKMYLEDVIERVWRCCWRLRSSELTDALADQEIEWTHRYTWWPRMSEFGHALGGWDRVNSEMQLEAVIEQVGRYTWRPWSITFGGVDGGVWIRGDPSGDDWLATDWSGGVWSEGRQSGGDWFEGCQSGASPSGASESGGSESGGGRVENENERDEKRWGKSSWETGT